MNTSDRKTFQALKKRVTTGRSWLRRLDTRFPEARPSSILFAGTMVAGLSNYVFNFLFGRLMTPNDYGLLISLLALAAIFSNPIASVNMLMTQRAATAEEHERPAVIRQSLVQILRWSIGLAIIMIVAILVGGDGLRNHLNIPETSYLILVAFLIEANMISAAFSGLVRGLEKFPLLSVSIMAQSLGRIGLGLGLLGLGLVGVVSATPLSYLLAVAICAGPLIPIAQKRTIGTQPSDHPLVSHLVYLIITQSIIGFLLNADMIFARRFLTSEEAGLYAALSVLGKTILYLPAAVGSVVYPRISRQIKQGIQGRPIKALLPGLTITLGISLPLIGLFLFIPDLFITILYGKQYLPVASLLGAYGLAILPMAMGNILSQYFIAARNKTYTILGGLTVIIEWWLLATMGSSLTRIVMIIGLVNAVFVIIVLMLTLRPAASTK